MTDAKSSQPTLPACPDCGTAAGQPHQRGCDVEHCSSCGMQRLMCNCEDHDPLFARWNGFWPGELEAAALGIDLNTFYASGVFKYCLVKPTRNGASQ